MATRKWLAYITYIARERHTAATLVAGRMSATAMVKTNGLLVPVS